MVLPFWNKTQLLASEKKAIPLFVVLFTLVSISGFVTYLFSGHGVWQQWTYLLHTLLGFVLGLLFLFFIVNHVWFVQGFRRPSQAFIGWSAALFVLLVTLSGVVIGVVGQYEAEQWIYQVHVVGSAIVVLLVVLHLFLFRLIRRVSHQSNEQNASSHFSYSQTITWRLAAKVLLSCIVSIFIVAVLSVSYQWRATEYNDVAAITPELQSSKDVSFFPSQAKTATGTFLDEKRIGRSERCGACHQQITDEWRASMHARSASDRFFQKNLQTMIGKKSVEDARYCGGCHVPVALMSGHFADGGVLDSGSHVVEGVSCMGCHGISHVTNLKGVGSYVYEAQQDYLFGDSDGFLQTQLHNYVMKINPRQHRKDMARDILYDPKSCATCHEQYIDVELNDWGWIKLQNQYQAWLKGPFSGHSDKTFSDKSVQRCQDCHFPMVEGDDPSANKAGKLASHRSPAANTAVPHMLGDKEQLKVVVDFMKANRVAVNIQLVQSPSIGTHASTTVVRNESARLNVSVTSRRIGHNFPAGTIDINQPWIELVVNDANDHVVFESGGIDANNHVDKEARFYFSQLVNRQGKPVWRHDLFNAVGESYVNLIPPGGSDIQTYDFFVPEWAVAPLKATATLRYRKFNQYYVNWALGNEKTKLPIVDMASAELLMGVSGAR